MVDRFRRAEFEIQIVFADSGTVYQDEVVSLSCVYALNSIPVATAVIASGREIRTGKESEIHKTIDQLILREKVLILVKIDTDAEDTGINGMRGQWCTVFEGYYAGSGYQRTHESANYTLQFIHWLDDLACSSALNGSWHPGVPHDLAQSAEGDYIVGTGGSNLSTITCIVDPDTKIIIPEKMKEDLWASVLKVVLDELARRNVAKQDAGVAGKSNNDAARDALKKMPGDSPNPAKLPFNTNLDSAIGLAARYAISDIFKNGLAYSSFWSKLIGELGAEFLFGVSPAATFANVIPYFGATKKEWVTITGAEYNYASFNSTLVSLINSVEIRFSQMSTSGFIVGGKPSMSTAMYYTPLARFPEEDNPRRGQIIIKDPPAWVTNYVPTARYSPWATGTQGAAGPSDNGQAEEEPPPGTKRPGPAEEELKKDTIMAAYAKHLYQTEVLAQRRGELSGKLRFDIAPGSIVKIEAPEADIPANYVELPLSFFAMVTQVSFVIDAEAHAAGTSFSFTNLRTRKENDNNELTSENPPLYPDASWSGGPLVKEAMP